MSTVHNDKKLKMNEVFTSVCGDMRKWTLDSQKAMKQSGNRHQNIL